MDISQSDSMYPYKSESTVAEFDLMLLACDLNINPSRNQNYATQTELQFVPSVFVSFRFLAGPWTMWLSNYRSIYE